MAATIWGLPVRVFNWLVPRRYLSDKNAAYRLLTWFVGGLFVRLLLMPFTAHPDLLAVYWRAHHVVYHGQLSTVTVNVGSHLIHAAWLYIATPLMPYYDKIWAHPWWWQSKTPDETMWQMFFVFSGHDQIFRTLFLLKLPYLIFDVAAALLILRFFTNTVAGGRAFKYWMVNPIMIFAVYVFGRYEVLAAFFVLLSVYFLIHRKQLLIGMAILGFSVTIRAFPILFVLPLAFVLKRSGRERLKLLLLTALPVAALMLLTRVGAGSTGEIMTWLKMPHFVFPLAMNFFLGFHDYLYVFVVGYTLIVLHAAYYSDGEQNDVWRYALVILLWLFSVSRFHPQYLAWMTIFLVFPIAKDGRFSQLHAIQVVTFVVYTFQWGRPLAGYLLAPFHTGFFANLPSPSELLSKVYPADSFVGIFRSVFTGVSLLMIFWIFQHLNGRSGERALDVERPE